MNSSRGGAISDHSDMTTLDALPVPPIESATDPIGSPDDLRQRWRALMCPLGFGARVLWVGFVGPDRRMIKALSDVPLGPRPHRRRIETLLPALGEVLGGMREGTTVAFLLTRPGLGPISDADRRWSTLLAEVAADLGLPIEPIFRANDESLIEVPSSAGAAQPEPYVR
jgi:hypothetical protein